MEDEEIRSFDERALWASLALELLAKAALARISPLLVASPTEDGSNLLIASGLVEGDANFKSVNAHTLFVRCARAFKPFSETDARKFSNARNEYLHGGGVGFVIPEAAWWPRFWSLASILVVALDSDLNELVGSDRLAIVENHLAQNKKNVQDRVETLVARAEQRFSQLRAGTASARVVAEWTAHADLSAGLGHFVKETCPACGKDGILEGQDVLRAQQVYDELDSGAVDLYTENTIGSDYFSCSSCKLVLDSYELIEEAGVATEFCELGEPMELEPDYGND